PGGRGRFGDMPGGAAAAGGEPPRVALASQRDDGEARVRAAELRYRTLVEQIPAVTFMAVLGEGENEVYVSPHIQTLLGFSQQEWLEDPFLWYRQLHPDDRALWIAEFARGCRTGGPFRAECRFLARDGGGDPELEYRALTLTGDVVWLHNRVRVAHDEAGRPRHLLGFMLDNTERRRTEDALARLLAREQEARAEAEILNAIGRRLAAELEPKALVQAVTDAATTLTGAAFGAFFYN